jgi:hypothetical protein
MVVLQKPARRVALTLALVLVATVMLTALRTAPDAHAATVSSHWWGYSVNLSRTETRTLANYSTTGGCAYLAHRVPNGAAAALVAVGCSAIANWSKYAYRYGYCVSFKLVRASRWYVVPWVRHC